MQTTQIYADNVAIYPHTNYEEDRAAYKIGELEKRMKEKAPLESPVLTGSPETPTAESGDKSQKIANTAFVERAILDALRDIKTDMEREGYIKTNEDGNIVFPGRVTASYFSGTATKAALISVQSVLKDSNTAAITGSAVIEEYKAEGSSNLPGQGDYLIITICGGTNEKAASMAVSIEDGSFWVRIRNNEWKQWQKISGGSDLSAEASEIERKIKCDFPEVAACSFMEETDSSPKERAASTGSFFAGDIVYVREGFSCTDGNLQWSYEEGFYTVGAVRITSAQDGTVYRVVGTDMEKIDGSRLTIGQRMFAAEAKLQSM